MADAGDDRRIERVLDGLSILAAFLLVAAAIGRQRALEPISPTDLAFFHQSTWSAAHGLGFWQTALRFEGIRLLECVHLSLVHALVVPLFQLMPGISTLVGVQALAVAAGAFPVFAMVRDGTGNGVVARIVALSYLLHPLTLELAVADFRPIVFLSPAVLVTLWGLRRRRPLVVLLGGLAALTAREEAPWVLAALLPHGLLVALREGRAGAGPMRTRFLPELVLSAVVLGGLAFLWYVWGRFSNFSSPMGPGETLTAILEGRRPIFANVPGAWFALVCLACSLPAFLAPELLLPGLGAWALLVVFPYVESVSPGGQAVHYLATVHPLLIGAFAVGWTRLTHRRRSARTESVPAAQHPSGPGQESPSPTSSRSYRGPQIAASIGLAVVLALSTRQTGHARRWADFTVRGPSDRVVAIQRLLEPVITSDAGVLTEREVAGPVAARREVHIFGEFPEHAASMQAVLAKVEWAIIARPEQRGEDPAPDRREMSSTLLEVGFRKSGAIEGFELWRRARSAAR